MGVQSIIMFPFLLEQKDIKPVSELNFESYHDYRKKRASDEDGMARPKRKKSKNSIFPTPAFPGLLLK